MAKGFKVIPKETPKKEEWDYERIKQRVKGKQIVFCLPGRGCSYVFLLQNVKPVGSNVFFFLFLNDVANLVFSFFKDSNLS